MCWRHYIMEQLCCVKFGLCDLVVGCRDLVCTYDYPEADMISWEKITEGDHGREPVAGKVNLRVYAGNVSSLASSSNVYVSGRYSYIQDN